MRVTIRQEVGTDQQTIYEVTKAAFAPMPFSQGDEQDLVNHLRTRGALAVSLVAEVEGEVIGHVALSPATHSSTALGWFGLGPISVAPEFQGRSIGGKLIAAAQDWIIKQGGVGCILVGNPAYYSRHGFELQPNHAPDREPKQYFMVWQPLKQIPEGLFEFHPVFYNP